MVNLLKLSEAEKKIFSLDPEVPYRCQKESIKNLSRFPMETNTSFYSEFNTDYEYRIIFEKYS